MSLIYRNELDRDGDKLIRVYNLDQDLNEFIRIYEMS